VVNPYNAKPGVVSLAKDDVDAFVFWTKNLAPFYDRLEEVRDRGYPFVIQFTINGYPRELEQRVVDWRRSVELARRASQGFGRRTTVWRYDTIVLSSITDRAFHVRNFARIAEELEGAVDEVVVSFVHVYEKTRLNLEAAAARNGFEVQHPSSEERTGLLSELVGIASTRGIALSVCSQPENMVPGASEARCVDAERLSDVAQSMIHAKLLGNRKSCGCFESRDIGEYESCPHGCVYCYAVKSSDRARSRFSLHDPLDEYLLRPSRLNGVEAPPPARTLQLPLFHKSRPTHGE
jgi:hypothetical protein